MTPHGCINTPQTAFKFVALETRPASLFELQKQLLKQLLKQLTNGIKNIH